ncbi:YchE family NAAT transporter [Thiomicrorhabdus cannonii]|uniref:YchE family NAAT transporter n=1 Tax=Thiomicrorhabdus cannonii TaxID=2748011 RepID=UPI0015BFBE72|nr:YchE family NAAT transporter [Thiomicrorhabdus cannonii]
MLDYTEYTKFLIGLIAIVNPIGVIPVFLALTADLYPQERRRIINMSVVAVASILLISLLFGEILLEFFGISINSFRVGGGILILLMAIGMMHAKSEPKAAKESYQADDRDSIAVVPLAIPLLAGPGAISTVIIEAHRGSSVMHYSILAGDILVIAALLWAVFQLTPWISRHLSVMGMTIVTRIMGLLLAAIAIEFIANGLKGLFPSLAA